MIGLGVSSISDSWYGFAQNEKSIEDYYARLALGVLPLVKGHLLSKEDLTIRRHILNLMCHFETTWTADEPKDSIAALLHRLEELADDGLITVLPNGIAITEAGKPFVRNVCMAFDLHLQRLIPQSQLFSMTV